MERQRQYVGIDLHRRRSVIVRRDANGVVLDTRRIDNDPAELMAVMEQAGSRPEVVLEACYGWYWAADLLTDAGAEVHLAHPLGNNWGPARSSTTWRSSMVPSASCPSRLPSGPSLSRQRSSCCARSRA